MRGVVGAALGLGLVAFLMFFPVEGQDSNPPRQWGAFGNEVPSPDSGLALTVGLAVFAAVLVLLTTTRRWWRLDR